MAQYPPAIAPTNVSALQEPISLQFTGNLITVGAPGGPVVFANPSAYIIPGLAGNSTRGVTNGHVG